jgi:hypothetical protein
MREKKIEDNLGFITWIVENKTKNKVNMVTLARDAIRFSFSGGGEAVESYERVEKTLDSWLHLIREIYNNPSINYVKIDRKDNLVKVGDKIIDIKRFEDNLKERLITKIEYECILNNIPYKGLENLYQCTPTEIMNVYSDLQLCIKNYCPSRRPVMPISLEIYTKGSRDILKL